jgi:xylulokinase
MCGLTLSHGRGHLYRALLEATAYGARHLLEVVNETGGAHGERAVSVGGGTKGGLWTQIVSDVTGRPQELPEETIGASYGDALLAARAVGLAGEDEDWNRIAGTLEPEEGNREVYDELYGVYRELYPATKELSHRLANLQEGDAGIA